MVGHDTLVIIDNAHIQVVASERQQTFLISRSETQSQRLHWELELCAAIWTLQSPTQLDGVLVCHDSISTTFTIRAAAKAISAQPRENNTGCLIESSPIIV